MAGVGARIELGGEPLARQEPIRQRAVVGPDRFGADVDPGANSLEGSPAQAKFPGCFPDFERRPRAVAQKCQQELGRTIRLQARQARSDLGGGEELVGAQRGWVKPFELGQARFLRVDPIAPGSVWRGPRLFLI